MDRCAAGCVAGRGLCEICANARTDLAGFDLLLIVQICVLKNDLHKNVFRMRDIDDRFQIFLNVFIITGEQAADVQNDIDLDAALFDGVLRFKYFGLGQVRTMRESDNGSHPRAAAFKDLRRDLHIAGTDANGNALVFLCDLAAMLDLVERECRIQKGVIDHIGDVLCFQRVHLIPVLSLPRGQTANRFFHFFASRETHFVFCFLFVPIGCL